MKETLKRPPFLRITFSLIITHDASAQGTTKRVCRPVPRGRFHGRASNRGEKEEEEEEEEEGRRRTSGSPATPRVMAWRVIIRGLAPIVML